jgi:heparosan-N-sulfate-glucuronate 5-epimerase
MQNSSSQAPVAKASHRAGERSLGNPGRFSSARSFAPPVGSHVRPGEVGGYYIDFTVKTGVPEWPPPEWPSAWLASRVNQIHIAIAQWGLGCHERYLRGEGDVWLAAATGAADHLIEHQERGGAHDGGWLNPTGMLHTYHLPAPWLSAMGQGEGASLLIRIFLASGDDRYAEAASRALRSFDDLVGNGGLRAPLGGGFFLEEYPTNPPSLVLNGGIFALWGCYDAAVGLADERSRRTFDEGVDTLAANLWRWDAGRWSLYDLFPHPTRNIASSAYHVLHTTQLRAMHLVAPRSEFESTADRFEHYSRSRLHRSEAFARKVAFRVLVPRNPLMAHRMLSGRRKATA